MENWGDFEDNLQTALTSEGALQEQADIYAESWEAARKRVKAAAEDVYGSLINPDFYIGMDNVLTPFLENLSTVIEAMGGMKGLLITLSALMTQVYGDKIAVSIRDMATNLGLFTGYEQLRIQAMRQEVIDLNLVADANEENNVFEAQRIETMKEYMRLQNLIMSKNSSLTTLQKENVQSELKFIEELLPVMDKHKQAADDQEMRVQKAARALEEVIPLTKNWEETLKSVLTTLKATRTGQKSPNILNFLNVDSAKGKVNTNLLAGDLSVLTEKLRELNAQAAIFKQLQRQLSSPEGIREMTEETKNTLISLAESFKLVYKGFSEMGTTESQFNTLVGKIKGNDFKYIAKDIAALRLAIKLLSNDQDKATSRMDALNTAARNGALVNADYEVSVRNAERAIAGMTKRLEDGTFQVIGIEDRLVQLASGLSRVSMGLRAIQNLRRVFSDEDMSNMDRLITAAMSLSMILPTITMAIKQLNLVTATSVIINDAGVKIAGKGLVAMIANRIAHKALTSTIELENKARAANNALILAQATVVIGVIAAIAALTGAIYLLVKAYNADADAVKEANKQTEALTDRFNECTNAAQELKTVISDYNDGIKALEELDNQAEEFKNTLEETNKKAKELIETYGLWDQYTTKDGIITFNEGALEDLQNKLDSDASRAESALDAGKIYSNQADIKNQINNTLKNLGFMVKYTLEDEEGTTETMARQLLQSELKSAVDFWDSTKSTPISDEDLVQSFTNLIPGLQLSIDGLDNFTNELDALSKSMNEATQANQYYAKEILKNTIEEDSGEDLRDIAQENEQLYNSLLSVMTERVNVADAQAEQTKADALAGVSVDKDDYNSNAKIGSILGTSIANDEALAKEYARQILGLDPNELTYKGGMGKGNLQDREGNLVFEESLSDEFMRKQLAIKAQQDEILASLTETTETFDLDAYKQSLQKLVDGTQAFSEIFGDADFTNAILNSLANGDYEHIDFSSLFAELSPEDIAQITNMTPEELMVALGLDEATLQQLGIENADTWLNNFLTELENSYDPEQFQNMIFGAAKSGEKSAKALIEQIQSGDVDYKNIGENEDFQDLLKQLKKVEDEYPELEAYQIELSKTWEVGTQKYIEALEEVQDKLANLKINSLVNDAQDAADELKDAFGDLDSDEIKLAIEADPQGFENAMEKILDANYAIDIEIHSQAEQEFNSIMNAMNDIEAKASMIGEDFIIAASNIRELNNAFPGIIQGLEDLGNGSVRINQQVAQAAIGAARTEVAADAEAAVNKLESQATLLRAKQEIYQQMAEAAAVLAGAEIDSEMTSDEARATLSAGLSELEQLNSQTTTNTEMTHAEEVATNANDNAEIVAKNWGEGFQSAAESSAEFARTAIANMKAAASGEGAVTTGNFTVNYQGSTGVSQEASAIQETKKILEGAEDDSQEAWARIAAAYRNMADSAGATANDIEGMIAQIGTEVGDLDHTFGNIESGKGPKGSSGGGGNKGGSGKEEDNTGKILDPEEKKDLDEINERYHEITREIQKQAELLDDISSEVERAYGVNKIRAYRKEQEALNKQLENQKKKLVEAEHYLNGPTTDDFKSDRTLVGEIFPQAVFDEQSGEILNYTQLLRDNWQTYNDFIDSYNAYRATYSTWTKDQQEAAEAELKDWEARKDLADETYEKNEKALQQYEETLDLRQELRNEIEQLQRDIDDNRLSQIEYRLEVVLQIKNMKDLVRDFSKAIAESFGDAITHGLKAATLNAEAAQAEAALYPEYVQQYASLKLEYEHADNQADRDRIIKDIEDLQGKVVDSGEALLDWIETLDDLLPDAIDDARERFEHFTNWLDHNTTVLDTIKELYALQGVTYKTQQGFERLQRTSAEKIEAATNKAALNRAWYENASAEVEAARQKLESLGGNEQDVRWDVYKANYDALLAEQQEAQEAMLSSAQEALETAREMATLSLEKTVYDLRQQLSKGLGLDLLQDKYDHYIEKEERYLDKVNEAYQKAAWYDKLQKDIDNTNDKAMRDRLKALQAEIDTRREGNKLSQYDLDILEAKYKVLQAQIALEDAQNAKNNMNLVRDRQGNWNYQFTADPDDIADAEQGLIDAENEWYNIAKQQVKDVTSEIIATMQECSDKVQEIWQQMIDGTLTEEEGYARIVELREYYTEKIKYLEEEKNVAIADMTEAGNKALLDMAILYGDEVSDLTGLTAEDVKRIIEESGMSIRELLLADNETIKGIVGSNTDLIDLFDNVFARDLANMTETAGNFETYLDEALAKCEANWQDYGDRVEAVADKSGTALDKLDEYVDDVAESNEWLYEAGMEATEALWEQLEATREASEGYAELAQQIMEVIRQLEALAAAQVSYVETKADLDNPDWITDGFDDYSREMARIWKEGGMEALMSEENKWLLEARNERIKQYGLEGKVLTNEQVFDVLEAANRGEQWAIDTANKVIAGEDYLDVLPFHSFDDLKLTNQQQGIANHKEITSIPGIVTGITSSIASGFKKLTDGGISNIISNLASKIPNSTQIATPSTTTNNQNINIERVELPNVTSPIDFIKGLTNKAAQLVGIKK